MSLKRLEPFVKETDRGGLNVIVAVCSLRWGLISLEGGDVRGVVRSGDKAVEASQIECLPSECLSLPVVETLCRGDGFICPKS